MQENEELNLENPIFVFYINVDGSSRAKIEQDIHQLSKSFGYSNVTTWFFPVRGQETRAECIYDGWGRSRDSELFDLIKEINNRIDILSDSKDFDDFKIKVRDWRLGNLLDGDNKE
jgi:hypothetical protein